ncbi:MAG: hypothetical protein KA236_06310 [Verrucomicrobia bacterium]|nr:hypothetical protein [Verrucomicrobiota bacterium]
MTPAAQMHIQQTKAESRATGGPQYYLHGVPSHVKAFLRARGACPVLLQTPYGIARSSFVAVGRDHKLSGGKVVAGRVGHDRIQGDQSIGEAIRYWYGLKSGHDFARVDLDVVIHKEDHFILIPTAVIRRGQRRPTPLEKMPMPLSFHRDHSSKLWRRQIENRRRQSADDTAWAAHQIGRIVREHQEARSQSIKEEDLLRAAGALSLLGVDLSPYVGKGYDCPRSRFHFAGLPEYPCPVEIKKRSSGFRYQVARYADLPRVVILCVEHDMVNPPDHVDIIELLA